MADVTPALVAVPVEAAGAEVLVVTTSVFSRLCAGADRRERGNSSGNARFERLCGFVEPMRGKRKREAKRWSVVGRRKAFRPIESERYS